MLAGPGSLCAASAMVAVDTHALGVVGSIGVRAVVDELFLSELVVGTVDARDHAGLLRLQRGLSLADHHVGHRDLAQIIFISHDATHWLLLLPFMNGWSRVDLRRSLLLKLLLLRSLLLLHKLRLGVLVKVGKQLRIHLLLMRQGLQSHNLFLIKTEELVVEDGLRVLDLLQQLFFLLPILLLDLAGFEGLVVLQHGLDVLQALAERQLSGRFNALTVLHRDRVR